MAELSAVVIVIAIVAATVRVRGVRSVFDFGVVVAVKSKVKAATISIVAAFAKCI